MYAWTARDSCQALTVVRIPATVATYCLPASANALLLCPSTSMAHASRNHNVMVASSIPRGKNATANRILPCLTTMPCLTPVQSCLLALMVPGLTTTGNAYAILNGLLCSTLRVETARLVLALLASNGSSRTMSASVTALVVPTTSAMNADLNLLATGTKRSLDATATPASTGTLACLNASIIQTAEHQPGGRSMNGAAVNAMTLTCTGTNSITCA